MILLATVNNLSLDTPYITYQGRQVAYDQLLSYTIIISVIIPPFLYGTGTGHIFFSLRVNMYSCHINAEMWGD